MNPTEAIERTRAMTDLTLTFTHAGQTRTLSKHPTVRLALRRGQITEVEARLRPWYLRTQFRPNKPFKLSATDADAMRAAKDLLKGHAQQPAQFSAFLASLDAKRGVTLGQLAADWFTAGLPFDGEAPRTTAAAAQLRAAITRALNFWSTRRPLAITHNTMTEFVAWRRAHVAQRGNGVRSADLELAALSALCQWAVLTDRLERNPFAKRKRFQQRDDVNHCHEAMPEDDDQFHAVLRWLFADPCNQPRVISGAVLAFGALTGLRPGEPKLLQHHPRAVTMPRLKDAPPGLIYPLPDGTHRMKVVRTKRGQNPAILITPVLEDFLTTWNHWLTLHFSVSDFSVSAFRPLFPVPQATVAGHLERACAALGFPRFKPHGFTRAYYVRVRRSQGADDTTIGVELGQSGNGELIRRVYGDPSDGVGGHLHDWFPTTGEPAWELLRGTTASQLLTVQFR